MLPNISDVAHLAGVSTATVSRYLRGLPVRSSDAIKNAIAKLDYHPSSVAQGLRSGIHYTIAVVVPDITNPFFASVVKGIESICREGPYQVLLLNTDENSKIEYEVLQEIVKRVDGVILTPATEGTYKANHFQQFGKRGIPLVLVDREIPEHEFDCVLIDNLKGASLAGEKLVQLGHTKIATIRGTLTTTPGLERYEGFRDTLQKLGVELRPEYCKDGKFRESGGYQAMLELASLPTPPTAVFSANNLMTVGALKALNALRIPVPEKISIIGFDDLQLGELLAPPLTCISRDAMRQGAIAARMLLTQLNGTPPTTAEKIVLDVNLVERKSCRKLEALKETAYLGEKLERGVGE